NCNFGSVEIDNERGAYEAVTALIEQGHARIAYLAGRRPATSDEKRRSGYTRALREKGLPFAEELVVELEGASTLNWPIFRAGADQCHELLRRYAAID